MNVFPGTACASNSYCNLNIFGCHKTKIINSLISMARFVLYLLMQVEQLYSYGAELWYLVIKFHDLYEVELCAYTVKNESLL